tara:strand:- start:456 stop:626 length:171 start_codon:yes stop_codon:yes gene_type:complete
MIGSLAGLKLCMQTKKSLQEIKNELTFLLLFTTITKYSNYGVKKSATEASLIFIEN